MTKPHEEEVDTTLLEPGVLPMSVIAPDSVPIEEGKSPDELLATDNGIVETTVCTACGVYNGYHAKYCPINDGIL